MSTFENILENLKKKYQQEYGVAVFDIEAKNTKLGIMIKGKVLTENQRDEVLEEFKKNKIKIKNENIKILSDAEKRNEIGWVAARNKIIDLKSRFVSNKIINNKILNRIRCSQALKGEILRVLYKYEDQLLVQQSDLTLGWVSKGEVIVKKKSLYKEWKKGNYAIKGKAIKITNKKIAKRLHSPEHSGTMEPANLGCHSELVSESVIDFKKNNPIQNNQKISEIKTRQNVNQKKILKQVQDDKMKNKIIKEAEKYLGVKYVLGGKSENGIDCSGLVQLAYKDSLGIILPKHSWDQKKVGRKVKLENIKTGDLIFLIKKENEHKHVGIAEVIIDKNPPTPLIKGAYKFNPAYQGRVNLIHASLNKKKVVRQKLEEVFESHDFAEARRVVE